ncbi:MAG: VOC family protein [Chloroflexota bacterium]
MTVNEVVPFLAVKNMEKSIAFYIDGLGFAFKHKWVDDGVLRWCQIELGKANLMLQQFKTEGHDSRQFSDNKGEGMTLCFFCDDAVEFYKGVRDRGVQATEPQVGNAAWVTELVDPDGYKLQFQSSTDVAEETRLSDIS